VGEAVTKHEAERFLGQEVAVTIDEDDVEFLGVKGKLTKVTDDAIELDGNEDELCSWRLSEIQAIEPMSDEWDQPLSG